jgi:multiple antibiotic resistance protein
LERLKEQLQAIVTVLSLLNPMICGMMFVQAEAGRSRGQQLRDATKVTLAVLVILVAAALIGTQLLHLFGVSLDAFMVAGGGVLAWMGFSMLSSQQGASAPATAGSNSGASLTPLILFAASPGTITGVITISAAHTRLKLPVTALVAIAVATVSTWVVMLLVARAAGKQDGGGFVRNTMTRLMGLIVLSMGVQFALTGYQGFTSGSTTKVLEIHETR